MEEQGSLAAGMSQTIAALVDGGAYTLFNVLSDVPLTFTLIDPNGRVIDPSVAAGDPAIAYFAQLDPESGLFWWYQYLVSNPMAGEWQNVLNAADPVEFSAFTMVDSAVQLHYNTDRYTYAPGEVVTVEAALASANVPILGAQMSGAVQNSDGSQLSLPLYDDGTHGDVTPGDGVFTGQFTAAGATGYASIELSGTEGLVSRNVTTNVAVTAQTAEFQTITAETPVDTNANGLYDMLNLSAQLNVITSGHFEVSATLVDSNDERIASGFFSTRLSGLGPLATGLQTIILSFDGNTIRQHGVDGPYQLTNLTIRDVSDGSFEVDTANNVYTTAAYQANQFEAPLISLAGGSEEVIDTNANGLYDQLRILVNVNVVRTGTYNWSGRLVDQRGAEIGWTQGAGTLNNQTPMAFTFAGQLIGAHGQDGPYVLRDVSIYQTSGGNATALFEEAYVTEPYSYLDFEGGIPANVASIVITKTVGLVDGVCATESEIDVATGATVYYCYTVTNTGDVTLDLHDLEDDVLGNLFTGLPYALAPDSSVSTVDAGLSFPYVANASTTNVATWTAYNATGLSATAVATATVNVASIYLVKTVGTTPGVCATTGEITVPAGTQVFYCYTVINTGDVTLNLHRLVDDQLGPMLIAYPYALTPGSSFNTVAAGLSLSAIINSTTTNVAAWMAYNDGGPVVTATDTATVIVAPPTAVTLADLSAAQAPPPVSGLPLAALPAVVSLALGAAYALRRRE
jgi:hypothetical protein